LDSEGGELFPHQGFQSIESPLDLPTNKYNNFAADMQVNEMSFSPDGRYLAYTEAE
jgi:hypothetical protein